MSEFEFPALETERLSLRAMGPEDVEFVFRHFSDEAVCRYLKTRLPSPRRRRRRRSSTFLPRATADRRTVGC